jgi:hypothetical protein
VILSNYGLCFGSLSFASFSCSWVRYVWSQVGTSEAWVDDDAMLALSTFAAAGTQPVASVEVSPEHTAKADYSPCQQGAAVVVIAQVDR